MILLLALALAMISSSGASLDAGGSEPLPPSHRPVVHGDVFPYHAAAEAPAISPLPAVAVPILRERVDGSPPVVGYQVLAGTSAEAVRDHLETLGIPTMALKEVGDDLDAHRSIAVTEDALAEALEAPLRPSLAMDHPVAPITDYTQVPVVLYADDAMEAVTNWEDKVHDAWTVAHTEIYDEADVHLYRYLLMTFGTPSTDVTDYCGTMQTGDYELGFTHRGAMILLYSPGTVEGAGGVALNGPLSAQIAGEAVTNVKWWWDHCTDSWTQTVHMPAMYVMDSSDADWMGRASAHEAAHEMSTAHSDGDCYSTSSTHWHRTIMTMTDDPTVDPDCQTSDANTYAHYHHEFSAASITKMWNERQRWTTCVNSGC